MESPKWTPPHGWNRLFNLANWSAVTGTVAALMFPLAHGWLHWIAAGLGFASLTFMGGASIALSVWHHRETGRWPVTWAQIRAELREDLRFGHKPWHKVALAILVLLLAVLVLLAWAASRSSA